jgi:hypothetical protein
MITPVDTNASKRETFCNAFIFIILASLNLASARDSASQSGLLKLREKIQTKLKRWSHDRDKHEPDLP